MNKPFIVLVNSVRPYSEEAIKQAREIGEKYNVTAMPVNCEQLKKEDINQILEKILYEFPLAMMEFYMPKWVEMLPAIHPLKTDLVSKVKDMMKNYVGHYVFMSKTFYENNIKQYKTNMIFVNTNENLNADVQNNISQEILNIEGVASVSVISSLMKAVSDMLNTMNYVVIILIVASTLLAFVVLYNLANINIAERQREIATLKVLGFYDKEVDNYINKENIIFTIIAIVIGLVLGTFLTSGIISSIEIDSLRFMKNILPISYVYSAGITLVFSIIVNFIIHFVLKKIDMIESLKSVE